MKIKLVVSIVCLDPDDRRVTVYRDGTPVEEIAPFTGQEAHTFCRGAVAGLRAAGIEAEHEGPAEGENPTPPRIPGPPSRA